MVSTLTPNGTAETVEAAVEQNLEPKPWQEYSNPIMLLNVELVPGADTAEGATVQLKKGTVILDLDFLAFKYGRDIQALGLSDNKDGWLELCDAVFDTMKENAQKEIDNKLMETAKTLHGMNPNKSVESIYKELKNITK